MDPRTVLGGQKGRYGVGCRSRGLLAVRGEGRSDQTTSHLCESDFTMSSLSFISTLLILDVVRRSSVGERIVWNGLARRTSADARAASVSLIIFNVFVANAGQNLSPARRGRKSERCDGKGRECPVEGQCLTSFQSGTRNWNWR